MVVSSISINSAALSKTVMCSGLLIMERQGRVQILCLLITSLDLISCLVCVSRCQLRNTLMEHKYVEKSPSVKVHRVTDPPPPPFFFFLIYFKYTFNFSQTVGEMVFVSFEVENMRMFLVQSMVRWCWVLLRSSRGVH